MKTSLVKLSLALVLAIGIAPGVASASGPQEAPAKSAQQKLLAKALTPQVRQTLQDAINSSDENRVTAR